MGKNGLKIEPGNMTILCIGAHPDDCEFRCSGTAALWAAEGNKITLVSMTDGSSGHHTMDGPSTADRRRSEAAKAAELIGAQSLILDTRDGFLEPNLENRFTVIRLVREIRPDVIITNRPNDYHPDHRYTSLLIQDSAYLFMVPRVVPEVPALDYNPVILYWADSFTYPCAFHADIAVDLDRVVETKMAMLAQHESQLFEWLPWIDRYDPQPPSDNTERMAWLASYYRNRNVPSLAERYRDVLIRRYGQKQGAAVIEAEAFEICEYGRRPTPGELEAIFASL